MSLGLDDLQKRKPRRPTKANTKPAPPQEETVTPWSQRELKKSAQNRKDLIDNTVNDDWVSFEVRGPWIAFQGTRAPRALTLHAKLTAFEERVHELLAGFKNWLE